LAGKPASRPCFTATRRHWRVNGKTHWLWCFASRLLTYFMIDRSRGSPALLKFFTETYASRRERLAGRLQELIDTPWKDSHSQRLVKRLRRHQDHVFTFLDQDGVPFDNNLDEREIRSAVIMRKNSYGNRSEQGADTQAILMSIFRTLRKRGLHPIHTTTNALATYLQTGQLPPLPDPTSAGE
jgi:hypothetical protein